MAQFRFPLESVLRHRTLIEEQCQRTLAQHQQKMRQSQDELRALDQTRQASLNDVRQNHLLGKLDLGFLAAYRRYSASVQRQGMTMAQKMALIQRDIDMAQKALAEAAKQRKIIDKLREKQEQRWKEEIARKEAIEMDEVSMRLASWRGAEDAGDGVDGAGQGAQAS